MPDIEELIAQHVAEKHAMGLHAVVTRHPTGGVEIEGFLSMSDAQARMDSAVGQHALTPLPVRDAKNVEHARQLGQAVDSEFASL